jgi:MFS family permease
MIAQTLGIIGAQGLLTFGDAATSSVFIGASILVSISFAPILLSVAPAPAVEVARPMSLRGLFSGSPLGTVGIFLLGGIYATQSGMGAVFGSQIGMTANEIALFIAMLFAGALALQYPIGWLSDRLDRRRVIFGTAFTGAAASLLGWTAGSDAAWFENGGIWPLMAAAFLAGGMTTPLYALLLAYTNDYLSREDMPAASGGLVFTFGLGAILGPLLTGWAMQVLGPYAFWLVIGAIFGGMAIYAAYRMTQRATAAAEDTDPYLGVLPTSSPVVVEAAGGWAAEQAEDGTAQRASS